MSRPRPTWAALSAHFRPQVARTAVARTGQSPAMRGVPPGRRPMGRLLAAPPSASPANPAPAPTQAEAATAPAAVA
ncbi:MAG: hypothetical protein C0467_15655 [Planctomycetaceae bacterium]|nr:hypothetical protein [Planctomycetaceae bacterium]